MDEGTFSRVTSGCTKTLEDSNVVKKRESERLYANHTGYGDVSI